MKYNRNKYIPACFEIEPVHQNDIRNHYVGHAFALHSGSSLALRLFVIEYGLQ